MKLFLVVIATLVVAPLCTLAFAPIHPCAPVSRSSNVAGRSSTKRPTLLNVAPDDDDDIDAPLEQGQKPNELGEQGGLDAEGFAGYLAPYALAAIASIGVTGAFVKFVLMEY
jgi:hypothetical protein